MWHSYHIYTNNREFFLKNLHTLQNLHLNSEFFFIQYLDPIGFHFRLRIRSIEIQEIENRLKTLFDRHRILNRIYDPEYNLFAETLRTYEEFSIELTKFLVNNREISAIYYVEDIIEQLLTHFGCNNKEFINFYRNYWGAYSRFQSSERKKKIYQRLKSKKEHDNPNFEVVISTLHSLEKQHLNEKLCFKFLHMTMNKMGFSIPDELDILSSYLQSTLATSQN